MDTNTQAPATDDQELAKVLESMNDNLTTAHAAPIAAPDEPADTAGDSGLPFETTPTPSALPTVPASMPEPTPVIAPAPEPETPPIITPDPIQPLESVVPVTTDPSLATVAADPALESIKKDALEELRPLVDKLQLAPEEKFDTLLLIIRSTDDKSLLSAAHDTAKTIEDEGKRAEALLDVIKEIDYFSNSQQQ